MRAPSRALVFRSGDSDQLLGLAVVALEFGVFDRPVGADAEPALHLHRRGMQAMCFAGEMQGAAADTAHVGVFVHQPDAVRHHWPEAAASRRQQRLLSGQLLPRRKGHLSPAAGLVGKASRLPVVLR